MSSVAIVVAAGKGKRVGGDVPKQFRLLLRMPVVAWALDAFEKSERTHEVVLVVPPGWTKEVREGVVKRYGFGKVKAVVVGGRTRQESMVRGFRKVRDKDCIICVHDGARPFVNSKLIDRAVDAAERFGASVVASPVKDTVKVTTDDGFVRWTPDRAYLWAAQTPQCFRCDILRAAVEDAEKEGFMATDDSSLVERIGERIVVVPGTEENIKITTEFDFLVAKAIAKELRSG